MKDLLRGLDATARFSAIFNKGDNICDFLFASLYTKISSEMGSTLKGKKSASICHFVRNFGA